MRASFLTLLKEAYTTTQLKVAALKSSPAIWQVITLLVSELRTLCECIGAAASMDLIDMEQAARQLECSSTGTSFFEAAAEFATNFVHKHVQVAELSP